MDSRQDEVEKSALRGEVKRLEAMLATLEARCAELDRLAHEDTLIPIHNRRGLIRQLDMMIARHRRHGDPAALLYIDLDGLKRINDQHGHQAGDAALRHVGARLVEGTRQSDCVARIGGDEFAILLERVDPAGATYTADRLTAEVAAADFCWEGTSLPLSIAIGLTMVCETDTPESAIARADKAMYRDKGAAVPGASAA